MKNPIKKEVPSKPKDTTWTPEKKYNKSSKALDIIFNRETKAKRDPQATLNNIRDQYVKDSTRMANSTAKKKK